MYNCLILIARSGVAHSEESPRDGMDTRGMVMKLNFIKEVFLGI